MVRCIHCGEEIEFNIVTEEWDDDRDSVFRDECTQSPTYKHEPED